MNHFEVNWVKDGHEGLALLRDQSFDLCLIDIMLPQMDGFTLAEQIRQEFSQVPFIFLTAKSLKIDKLKGFRLGADDFITKPVDEEELIARINAVLKRAKGKEEKDSPVKIGETLFNSSTQSILFMGEEVHLTNKEAAVLLLSNNKNKITQRDAALKKIWGSNDFFNRRSMDVIISRLRKHLSKDTSISIRNIHGKGYMLAEL
jgi:DNA-binding response OmpR family regulator